MALLLSHRDGPVGDGVGGRRDRKRALTASSLVYGMCWSAVPRKAKTNTGLVTLQRSTADVAARGAMAAKSSEK